jgi:hypothetical protein
MIKTLPAIRVQEDEDDIVIRIDKEVLVYAFENHPEIHYFTDHPVPTKIKDRGQFFEKLKLTMIDQKNPHTGSTWTGSFIDEMFLHLWQEGDAQFIYDFEEMPGIKEK